MSQLGYNTYQVQFEHTIVGSDTLRNNTATVTIYGEGELKVVAALRQLYPEYRNITPLEITPR